MRRSHSLGFVPALEGRCLLAGNVVFQLSGTTLRLTGDNSANEISISQSVGGLQVQALNGTRLNGVLNGIQTIANPSQINLDLRGGNDILRMADFVGGDISGLLGSGNDQVVLTSVVNDGAMSFDLGSGNDRWETFDAPSLPNQFGGNLTVNANSGNDRVNLDGFVVLGNLTVQGGNGVDHIAVLSGIVEQDTNVDLGTGNDFLLVSQNNLRSTTSFLGNTGNDLIGLRGNTFLDSAIVNLGNGNDNLLMDGNQFAVNLSRIGGTGTDLAYQTSDIVDGTNNATGFETLLTVSTPRVVDLYNLLNGQFD